MGKYKTPNLKNPNPNKVVEFGESGTLTVSPGDKDFGGVKIKHNPTQGVPGEINLNKFYQGKK